MIITDRREARTFFSMTLSDEINFLNTTADYYFRILHKKSTIYPVVGI